MVRKPRHWCNGLGIQVCTLYRVYITGGTKNLISSSDTVTYLWESQTLPVWDGLLLLTTGEISLTVALYFTPYIEYIWEYIDFLSKNRESQEDVRLSLVNSGGIRWLQPSSSFIVTLWWSETDQSTLPGWKWIKLNENGWKWLRHLRWSIPTLARASFDQGNITMEDLLMSFPFRCFLHLKLASDQKSRHCWKSVIMSKFHNSLEATTLFVVRNTFDIVSIRGHILRKVMHCLNNHIQEIQEI